ncbi:putative periplasmic protein [Salmonella enterica subsp. enterica]|uniref:Putative periplasmic protein n=1 Tax=Salmonella enterica I TaxID=59201 RepID=A0A379VS35_SALET|nr:putative periplasmic protein [Salmonella enterica subsp. enterica]
MLIIKSNLLDDDDQFYKDAGISTDDIVALGMVTSSNYSLILLKPAFRRAFSFFITTVLKTERTVPWAQIEQFLFALYGLLIARQKEHANDQSRPASAFQNRASLSAHATGAATAARPAADIILHNGNIITLNDAQPQASALAISGSRIVAIGDDTATDEWRGDHTRTIDLQGKTVIPGLTDTHIHAIRGGQTWTFETYWYDSPSLKDALDNYAPTLTVVPTING